MNILFNAYLDDSKMRGLQFQDNVTENENQKVHDNADIDEDL